MSVETPALESAQRLSWRSRLLRSRGFAWSVSVVLHGLLFAAFYQMGFARAAQSRELIIPEARLAASPAPTNRSEDEPVKLVQPAQGAAPSAARTPRLDELPIISVDLPDTDGASTSGRPAVALPGLDVPTGGAAAGSSAGAGGVGPITRFFGLAGNAYKVAYVVDVSVSIDSYTQEIIQEMVGSVQGLVPTQSFHVVLAVGDQVREFEPRRLVPANAAYKNSAFDFIRHIASPRPGSADIVEAMRRAFAVRPELVYLLTDGDYSDFLSDDEATQTELETALRRLNPDRQVKITVIGYGITPPEKQKPGMRPPPQRKFLERIAREHGGHCRFVEPE